MRPENVPVEFEQTMGCTPAELIRALPVAIPGAQLSVDASACQGNAVFADGALKLSWQILPPRRIALLEIPCLKVKFLYANLTAARRREVQRRFDLGTQRGGG